MSKDPAIVDADVLIVLRTHAELVARGGLYARLNAFQAGGGASASMG